MRRLISLSGVVALLASGLLMGCTGGGGGSSASGPQTQQKGLKETETKYNLDPGNPGSQDDILKKMREATPGAPAGGTGPGAGATPGVPIPGAAAPAGGAAPGATPPVGGAAPKAP